RGQRRPGRDPHTLTAAQGHVAVQAGPQRQEGNHARTGENRRRAGTTDYLDLVGTNGVGAVPKNFVVCVAEAFTQPTAKTIVGVDHVGYPKEAKNGMAQGICTFLDQNSFFKASFQSAYPTFSTIAPANTSGTIKLSAASQTPVKVFFAVYASVGLSRFE